jgi:hypothetical protein
MQRTAENLTAYLGNELGNTYGRRVQLKGKDFVAFGASDFGVSLQMHIYDADGEKEELNYYYANDGGSNPFNGVPHKILGGERVVLTADDLPKVLEVESQVDALVRPEQTPTNVVKLFDLESTTPSILEAAADPDLIAFFELKMLGYSDEVSADRADALEDVSPEVMRSEIARDYDLDEKGIMQAVALVLHGIGLRKHQRNLR